MTPWIPVASAVAAILVALIGQRYRNSRRSPESRTALDEGWEKLTGGMDKHTDRIEKRLDKLEDDAADKDQRIDHQADRISELEAMVATLTQALVKVRALNDWLTRRVEQLVAFIVGHGLVPPVAEPRPHDDDPNAVSPT